MDLNLPPNEGDERDAAILQRVSRGDHDPLRWVAVHSTQGGHTAEFYVFADALQMDGVRVNVSAELSQQIADTYGCSLLTPKIADLLWAQRTINLHPFPRGNTDGMDTTAAMIEHSAKIDAALAGHDTSGALIATVGKHWVLDNDLVGKKGGEDGGAMNYGWHFEGDSFEGLHGGVSATLMKDSRGSYVRMIQDRGHRHNFKHTDYSQTCVLVSRGCYVDGEMRDLLDVFQDAALAGLASHQGVLRVLRQPDVPLYP